MEVRYSDRALRELRRCHKQPLIRSKIDELAKNSTAMNTNLTRLQGRAESRLRVQDWRVIFHIEDGILWIDRVAPRGSAYEVT